jgi:hypothetical protein
MRVSIKSLIDISLILIFFACFQGGKYFMNNRFQEIGIALVLVLFVYSSTKLAWSKKNIHWAWWFWSAPLFVFYTMGISSLTFSIYSKAPMLLSFFAAREFLIVFLAPTIYFLYHLGYSLKRFENILYISLVIIIVNYIFHYFRIDLQAAYMSTGYMSLLVTHDEWRGLRLKPPTFGMIILTFYIFMALFQKDNFSRKLIMIVALSLVTYVWLLIMARSQMASLALALILYQLLFSRPKRINFIFIILPLVIYFTMLISSILIDKFAEKDQVRTKSFITAIEQIKQQPVLGYGQHSNYGTTYQDIFGKKFFPSDLGIVGIAFKYGFLGAFVYVFFNFFLFKRLIRANWYYRYRYGHHNPMLWTLLIWITGMTINFILNAGLAYMQGLSTAAIVIGLTSCYLCEEKDYSDSFSKNKIPS